MEFLFLATDNWWQVLLGSLSEVGLIFASALLTMLGGFLIKWISKKLKVVDLEKQKSMEEVYDKLVEAGISFAEQEASKLSDKPKDGSAKKLDNALDFIQKMIKDWKLPDKTADWVEKKIEAKLGESKVDAEKVKDLNRNDKPE